MLTGQFDPNIGFIFVTDQANWGRNGDYTALRKLSDPAASVTIRETADAMRALASPGVAGRFTADQALREAIGRAYGLDPNRII